jgi:hypothetical protein
MLRYGDPLGGGKYKRPSGMSAHEAFRYLMPGDPPETGCWDWPHATKRGGYGQICVTVDGKELNLSAHRVSYEIYHGEIPDELNVLHWCDRGICVHPRCLHLGTMLENTRECIERGRFSRGSKHTAKLSEEDVLFIRSSDIPGVELARRFGVSQPTISNVRTRKNWKHL